MIKPIRFIPGIIWFIITAVLLFTPGQDFPNVDDWFHVYKIDKLIHISLFAGLGYLFSFPFIRSNYSTQTKYYYVIRVALAVCLWGITSEFIQKIYIPNRSFDLFDWAADSAGAALALIFFLVRLKKLRS